MTDVPTNQHSSHDMSGSDPHPLHSASNVNVETGGGRLSYQEMFRAWEKGSYRYGDKYLFSKRTVGDEEFAASVREIYKDFQRPTNDSNGLATAFTQFRSSVMVRVKQKFAKLANPDDAIDMGSTTMMGARTCMSRQLYVDLPTIILDTLEKSGNRLGLSVTARERDQIESIRVRRQNEWDSKMSKREGLIQVLAPLKWAASLQEDAIHRLLESGEYSQAPSEGDQDSQDAHATCHIDIIDWEDCRDAMFEEYLLKLKQNSDFSHLQLPSTQGDKNKG